MSHPVLRILPPRYLLLCLLLCLLLPNPGRAASCPTEDAAQEQPLRIGALTFPGTPWYQLWVDFMRDLSELPHNQVKVIPYVLGQLGSEESASSQLRRGRIQMAGFSLQGASAIVPELGILLSPYLFDSFEEVDYVVDQYLDPLFKQMFAEKNMVLLRWSEIGWTSFYSHKVIRRPEDTRGLRLRSSHSLPSQHLIHSAGANAMAMTFADLIPSLQTGLVDGGTSGLILFVLSGAGRYAPKISLTRHAYDSGVIAANRCWWQALSEQTREDILYSLPTLDSVRRSVRMYAESMRTDPERYGIDIYHLSAEERNAWKEATRDDHLHLIDKIGGRSLEVYETVQKAKKEFAMLGSQKN